MSGEAYVIIKQNEYLRKFRQAGATDPSRARTLADLKVKRARIFRRMENKDVFRPGRAPATFDLDQASAEEFIEARRRRIFYTLLAMIVIAAVLFFLGRR